MLQFLGFLVLLSSACFADIGVTVKEVQSIENLANASVSKGVVYYDADSKPKINNAVIIKVDSPAKTVTVTAVKFAVVDGQVIIDGGTVSSEDRTYKLTGAGSYYVTIVATEPGYEQVSRTVTVKPYIPPDEQVVLTGAAKEARDALLILTKGMASDMKTIADNIEKYKTVTDASNANNALDDRSRLAFKQAMAKIMQPRIGSEALSPSARKVFEDLSIGFGAVK